MAFSKGTWSFAHDDLLPYELQLGAFVKWQKMDEDVKKGDIGGRSQNKNDGIHPIPLPFRQDKENLKINHGMFGFMCVLRIHIYIYIYIIYIYIHMHINIHIT